MPKRTECLTETDQRDRPVPDTAAADAALAARRQPADSDLAAARIRFSTLMELKLNDTRMVVS